MSADPSLGRALRVPIPIWVVVIIVVGTALGNFLAWTAYFNQRDNDIAGLQHALDQKVTIVCERQDGVLGVIRFIVSPERQALVLKGEPSAAVMASNRELHRLVDSVQASPCPIKR